MASEQKWSIERSALALCNLCALLLTLGCDPRQGADFVSLETAIQEQKADIAVTFSEPVEDINVVSMSCCSQGPGYQYATVLYRIGSESGAHMNVTVYFICYDNDRAGWRFWYYG